MFSASTRAYLRFKNIPYIEVAPSILTYMVTIKRRCGNAQVPVLVDPDGMWLSDSSEIIDVLEARFPEMPVLPATPQQRFAAYLFELWGNEFWYPAALHTRWSHPENYPVWEADMGRMFPGLPRWLRGAILRRSAQPMLNAHLKPQGVDPENFATIDHWTETRLDLLDAHFAEHDYLFGTRPSLGDMGIVATLFGHCYLDPWSRRHLIDPRPHLKAWIERVQDPQPLSGEFLADDRIPDTLVPLLQVICRDTLPYLAATLGELESFLSEGTVGDRLPRMLGMVTQPMGKSSLQRAALPYTLWMAQRMLDSHRAMSPNEAHSVRAWLRDVGGEDLLDLEIPRLARVGLHAALATGAE